MKEKLIQKFDLQERLVKFSANIILSVNGLSKGYASEHLAKQLIRSATSSALNYGEAQSAESKKDFIHKMKICLKELRESQINLQILNEAQLINDYGKFNIIKQECKELVAIFTTSIKTSNRV
ncbi:four helix bundle protein [Aquimarina sp. I32.4]|uniref:four helix bundle protein n=1 Tax=Aquimarina sp. I32.4 TaxID=2053903 RepID=UPI001E5F6CAB|nr:four helix bundle protein [Aquimarina sp. I32.4]